MWQNIIVENHGSKYFMWKTSRWTDLWDPNQPKGGSAPLWQTSQKEYPGKAATQLRSGAWEWALAPFNLFIGKQPVSPRTVSHRALISQLIHKHLEAAIHPAFDPRQVKIGLGDKSCSDLKHNCFGLLWSRRSSLKWSLNQEAAKQWPIRTPNGFQPLRAAFPACPHQDVSDAEPGLQR